MGFQILNKEGEALTMNALDKEAAEFWKQEVKPKDYAKPYPIEHFENEMDYYYQSNWFDKIGWLIHNPETNNQCSWTNVKRDMILVFVHQYLDSTSSEEFAKVLDWVRSDKLKPYLDLIDHWASKGYEPKSIAE